MKRHIPHVNGYEASFLTNYSPSKAKTSTKLAKPNNSRDCFKYHVCLI